LTGLAWLLTLAVAAPATRQSPPRIGEPVPSFEARALDGRVVSLEHAVAAHRFVVVVFLSTACPFANHFGRHLGILAREREADGVLFVGVNSNESESEAEILARAREHGQGFPQIRDESARIADRLGASCSPEAYVIDHEQRLRYHGWILSRVRSPDLQRALEALLQGRPPRLARTKAFGCAIDRPVTTGPETSALDTQSGPGLR
jgi:peroxiredoxin